MKTGILALIFISQLANVANSAELTSDKYSDSGAYWINLCRSDYGSTKYELCLAYVSGLWTSLDLMNDSAPRSICTPATINRNDVVNTVVQYMLANPAIKNNPFHYTVKNILLAAFPCKPTPKPAIGNLASDARFLSPSQSILILTNILNSSNVGAYKIFPPAADATEVAFKTPHTSGYIILMTGRDTLDADYVSSIAIERFSASCKGASKQGKLPVSSIDGSVVRRVIATCELPSGVEVTQETTVIRRADGFLTSITEVYDLDASVPPSVRESRQRNSSAIVDAALRLP